MTSLDLATAKDVQEFLTNGPFASHEVVPLPGGFGNFTFRLRLREAYQCHQTLILKHGKDYIAAARSIPFALERQNFEQTAMRRVRSLFPEDSLINVPEIFLYDDKENIIIMEDCGEHSVTLKNLLKDGPSISTETVRKIGATLGTFLARLHSWGKDNQEVLDIFDENKQARTISAWATYGRLVETLSGESKLPRLGNTPLGVSADKLQLVAQIAKETTEKIQSARETLVMGDFWPGNVLLSLTDETGEVDVKRIFIVDWELVKPGRAGMDIGQFCAEMHQMRRFYPTTEPLVLELVAEFLGTYRLRNGSAVELTQAAKVALTQIGAHLVAFTPRSGWEGGETMRKVVLEGVQCLLDGHEGKQEKIDESFVGGLTASKQAE
ncbi:hypothetical protein EIP86_004519 [Pleurotus ostreatoroseus]|nr:hypothetical protein EIP86_004519 [Pleurotus ostreatoroseus]